MPIIECLGYFRSPQKRSSRGQIPPFRIKPDRMSYLPHWAYMLQRESVEPALQSRLEPERLTSGLCHNGRLRPLEPQFSQAGGETIEPQPGSVAYANMRRLLWDERIYA